MELEVVVFPSCRNEEKRRSVQHPRVRVKIIRIIHTRAHIVRIEIVNTNYFFI